MSVATTKLTLQHAL